MFLGGIGNAHLQFFLGRNSERLLAEWIRDVVVVFYDSDVLFDDAIILGKLASKYRLRIASMLIQMAIVCSKEAVQPLLYVALIEQGQAHPLLMTHNKIIDLIMHIRRYRFSINLHQANITTFTIQ